MSGEPTVSVVIPTMDRADRLERAVESVVNQTYDDIEIIVVDGGSTDRTPNLVSEYQQRLGKTRVTYLRNENPQGLPAARNQGVEATDTDYIAFLDDDDIWHSPKTERQVDRLDPLEGEGMCYTGITSRTPDGEYVYTRKPAPGNDLYARLLIRNVIGTPSTVLVTREAFEEIGQFDADLRYQEDWDFYLRMAQAYDVACVSDPLVTRISHDESMSSDVETQKEYRERILDRYADERGERGLEAEARATHHRDTGIAYCLNDEIKAGAREFRTALQYRVNAGTILLYLLSRTGKRGFRTAVRTKRNLNRAIRMFS